MKTIWQKLHEISDKLHLPSLPNWLTILLALILILRVPSFFEPYYYGDEMIYMTLGQGVRQGVPLYSGIYDNKPPLLYLTAAASESLFWFKIALAVFNLVSIVIFFKITKTLFEGSTKLQKLATGIFALLTTLPLLEGGTANAENFMMLPSLAAFYILLAKPKKFMNLFLAGFLFGIASLYKIPAAFEVPVIIIYWLVTSNFNLKSFKEILINSFYIAIGFVIPFLLSFAWFFFMGSLMDYIKAAFLQNVGYLSSFRPGDIQKPFLVRNAPLFTRAGIVVAGILILTAFRKKLSKNFIFIVSWLLFALFAITLSERPYPHYFLQGAASISLLLGILFTEKTFEQSLTVIPLALAFLVPVYYHFWLYPTTPYYLRFVNFITGKISKVQYFKDFDPNTPRNYQIAEFLSQSSTVKDRIFIWDPDAPTVYALARRLPPVKFVVPYHVNDYSSRTEVAKQIEKSAPKFIVLISGNPFPEIASFVQENYISINQIDNAAIWSRVYNSSNVAK